VSPYPKVEVDEDADGAIRKPRPVPDPWDVSVEVGLIALSIPITR
jgi:hypothetical protein